MEEGRNLTALYATAAFPTRKEARSGIAFADVGALCRYALRFRLAMGNSQKALQANGFNAAKPRVAVGKSFSVG